MKVISKVVGSCLVATTFLLSATVTPAAVQTWNFNLSESSELPDGTVYATVSLSYVYDGGKRGVRITVTANESVLSPCDNFGIQRFGFNTALTGQPGGCAAGDTDGDGVSDCVDNCVGHPNGPLGGTCARGSIGAFCMNHSACGTQGFCSRSQEDTFPPGGNTLGDACECEGDFDHNTTVDGFDAVIFRTDYGRSSVNRPCTDADPCYGDFSCTGTVDGFDAALFKSDFGRNSMNNPCPASSGFWADVRMTLPAEWSGTFGSCQCSEFGRFQIDVRGKGSSRVNPLIIDMYHLTGNLSYTDFAVPNESGRFFSAHIADFSYQERTQQLLCSPKCMSGCFADSGDPLTTTTAPLTTTSTSVIPACTGNIYKGGTCDLGLPIDDPAYNRPGRRGLALTCEDIVDFCVCTDCGNHGAACLIWTIDPADPYLSISAISTSSARLTVGESCDELEDIREYTVTVTDTCNGWTDSVVVELGRVAIDVPDVSIQKGGNAYTVPVTLVNRYSDVRALGADICECEGGDDKMACAGCTVDPARALAFSCAVAERDDGCCSVIMFATNPAALIFRGAGPVVNVIYEPTEQFDGCSCLRPVNRQVADRFNEALSACQSPGEICFTSCGDIYPRDCTGPNCAPCGDNAVDLYDVLEAIDIILGFSTPTDCQIDHGDVPNGLPPYCGDPAGTPDCGSDGDIDILDALVIIDMAQGRSNCCDYCQFRRIF
jgi:hypothetical protein